MDGRPSGPGREATLEGDSRVKPEVLIRAPGNSSPATFALAVQDLRAGTHRRDATMKKSSDRNRRAQPITYGAVRRIGPGAQARPRAGAST
jgi:hypothetical protein